MGYQQHSITLENTLTPPTLVNSIVSWENPHGYLTMEEFGLEVGVLNVALMVPHMKHTTHARKRCNGTTAAGW